MWITNLINESNETYETNKITLTAVKETITQWAAGQKVNAYILNVTAKNRILSILTRSGKGYEYKSKSRWILSDIKKDESIRIYV